MRFLARRLASWQEKAGEAVAPGRIDENGTPSREQEHEFRRLVCETLGYRIQRNGSVEGEEPFFPYGGGKELQGVRSWVKRWTAWPLENRRIFGLGLINENGRPVWEEAPGEAGHEFRRHVYDTLRYCK